MKSTKDIKLQLAKDLGDSIELAWTEVGYWSSSQGQCDHTAEGYRMRALEMEKLKEELEAIPEDIYVVQNGVLSPSWRKVAEHFGESFADDFIDNRLDMEQQLPTEQETSKEEK